MPLGLCLNSFHPNSGICHPERSRQATKDFSWANYGYPRTVYPSISSLSRFGPPRATSVWCQFCPSHHSVQVRSRLSPCVLESRQSANKAVLELEEPGRASRGSLASMASTSEGRLSYRPVFAHRATHHPRILRLITLNLRTRVRDGWASPCPFSPHLLILGLV